MKNNSVNIEADLVLESRDGLVQMTSSHDEISLSITDFRTTAFLLKKSGFKFLTLKKFLNLSSYLNQSISINIDSKNIFKSNQGRIKHLKIFPSIYLLYLLLLK